MKKAGGLLSCLLGGLLIAPAGLFAAGPAGKIPADGVQTRRPNVIFIITDDQHRDTFGFLGGDVLTPNIDRLAHEGAYFDHSYVVSSVCSPSRYTCLSGQAGSRSPSREFKQATTREGVTRVLWNVGFGAKQWNLPRAMQAGGYKTGFVGKWHLNGVLHLTQPIPEGSDPADPAVKKQMRINHQIVCNDLKKWGFDYCGSAYGGNLHDDANLRHTGCDEHNMEWLTKAAVDFIDENKDEPFYLYFAPTLLHVPDVLTSLKADPRISGEGLLDEPITGLMPSREDVLRRVKAAGLPEEAAAATWLDDGVGAVREALERNGIADNTMIIYFNDHGMEYSSKGTCYQGGLLTPTMAWWPGRIQPQVCEGLIQNTDFAPTIMDACGVQVPADMVLDGASFMPLLDGSKKQIRTSTYSEIGLVRAIATERYKYIAFHVPASLMEDKEGRMATQIRHFEEELKNPLFSWLKEEKLDPEARWYQMGMSPGGHRFEREQVRKPSPWKANYFDADQLYDLEKDPLETTNLANDPEHAAVLKKMKALLSDRLSTLPGTYPDLKE